MMRRTELFGATHALGSRGVRGPLVLVAACAAALGVAVPANAATAPVNVTLPSISGPATILPGPNTLVASPGTWSADPADGPLSFTYQWQQCTQDVMFICSDIAGATGDTYLHTPTISTSAMYKVVVAARNNAGTSAPILGPTGVFEPGYVARVSLTNSVLPSISGSPTVGQTLSSTLGTWLGMLSPIQGSFGGDAIRVQWERCASATAGCSDIPNTLSAFSPAQIFQNALASYTLQAGDAGYWIRARVTAFRQGSTCTVCGNVTVWAVPVGPVAKGAADQLSDLGVAVSNVGPGKSLAKKVKDAQAALGTNDVPGTCSILGAFISEVRAQSGKKFPPFTAATLTSDAAQIKALLDCS